MKNVLIHAAAGVEMKEDSAVSHGHTLEKKFSKRNWEGKSKSTHKHSLNGTKEGVCQNFFIGNTPPPPLLVAPPLPGYWSHRFALLVFRLM